MSCFHSNPSPYRMTRNDNLITVENEYTRWVHDLKSGGELMGAYVKNGSNENLLLAPQKVSIGILEGRKYHLYESSLRHGKLLSFKEKDDRVEMAFSQILADQKGKVLPGVRVKHSVCYHPWGYACHQVAIEVEKRIERVAQIQIGALMLAPTFDCCAVREGNVTSGYLSGINSVVKWQRLSGGRTRDDLPVFVSHWVPLSINLFKFGQEGIEYSLDDNLAAWDNIVRKRPGWQKTYITYDKNANGYEVRVCPVDAPFTGQYLSGNHTFGFRLALPHVRSRIVPLRPSAGHLLCKERSGQLLDNARGFAGRWPTAANVAAWKKTGITLMRLHNDGDDCGNGIFWRDADYPPYPPAEMKRMDAALRLVRVAGISVAPYFSVKEYHPEAPGFAENARKWMRLAETGGEMIHNFYLHGEYGAQMCLKSGWFEKRRETIAQALDNHEFDSVYFDWCAGYECVNPTHTARKARHWDQDALQELLEWSHQRVGPAGDVYLHLTGVPNLAAENLASLVLTEESGYGRISPLMFTPHVHFMNIAPRQICDMLGASASSADRRKLALCALLHHASVSSKHQDYLAFYQQLPNFDFERYSRHTASGENIAHVTDPAAGFSAYWNANEALLLFANPTDRPLTIEWRLDTLKMGQAWAEGKLLAGKIFLKPGELKTRKIKRYDRSSPRNDAKRKINRF